MIDTRQRKATIKSRIIIIMTVFALLIAGMLSFFSYELISYFQRKTTIQATEFNLQLVSHIIDQDLNNLSALAMSSSTNSPTNQLIQDYFVSPDASAKDGLNVFSSMQEDFRVNRSNSYVRRLIITDHQAKFIQVDNSGSASVPLNIHNISQFPGLSDDAIEAWERIIQDPLSRSSGIPYVLPIYGDRAARIGTVYLLANTSVITDKLKGYSLPEGSELLLTLGSHKYLIEGDKVQPLSAPYAIHAYDKKEATGALTQLAWIEQEGKRRISVSYPVREGIVLSQTLDEKQFAPQLNAWLLLMIGVSVLVIALSGFITLYLTRTISLPVEKLRKRIDKIAQGNFLIDRNIEWNSELGDVGRGINRLSHDILTLMDSRVADEKQKQELEYRMLQSQISPHFLYNTLNSIKWMATIQNATGIAEMTTSLSRLLRSIAKDHRKLVPLREELSLMDDYFLIQKYRYGSTITMEQNIEEEALLSGLIPRFTLQPLVENAIFHGIEPKGRGEIAVTVAQSGGYDIRITIEDNGIGMSEEQIAAILSQREPGSKGLFENVGLLSVHERLRLTFGERYGLSIESELGQYTRMSLLLPYRKS
ncbi:cache domain-containing sensor histidine kinase [Paenibacillus rubinfantis]|uniref:cache domain-containing sensor histidine kinase n=1 Tax=Paenibacillus rubinfantis TaxID=1720296 RepID=UPI00073EB843|nr:histidine kinase [Paenibacillus rubinfantis]